MRQRRNYIEEEGGAGGRGFEESARCGETRHLAAMARVAAETPADAMRDIQLLKDEEGGLMYEEGIATISFYKGDFRPAADALRAQLALVVASNPWLAGRLVKADNGLRLRHPASPSPADIDSLFTATAAGDAGAFKLRPSAPYTKICTDLYQSGKAVVGSGTSLVGKAWDKAKPVALLTLAESAPGEFALIFSMSHAVGDGRTYYEIFQMLQPGAAVRVLSTDRVMSFSEAMRDVCGRKDLEWAEKAGSNCLMIMSLMFQKKVKCFAWHLDSERLAAAKSAAAADGQVPYVSTNDVLTSAFFTKCRTRIGFMGMDCRERIKDVSKDLAGNYVTALVMDPHTFKTPASVRKMLSSTPHETTHEPLPTCCGYMCGGQSGKSAMVTNWSSFAGGLIQLQGCEMVIHLPVKVRARACCCSMRSRACSRAQTLARG